MQEASRDKRARHRTSRHVSSRSSSFLLLFFFFFSFSFVVGLRSLDQLDHGFANLRENVASTGRARLFLSLSSFFFRFVLDENNRSNDEVLNTKRLSSSMPVYC